MICYTSAEGQSLMNGAPVKAAKVPINQYFLTFCVVLVLAECAYEYVYAPSDNSNCMFADATMSFINFYMLTDLYCEEKVKANWRYIIDILLGCALIGVSIWLWEDSIVIIETHPYVGNNVDTGGMYWYSIFNICMFTTLCIIYQRFYIINPIILGTAIYISYTRTSGYSSAKVDSWGAIMSVFVLFGYALYFIISASMVLCCTTKKELSTHRNSYL